MSQQSSVDVVIPVFEPGRDDKLLRTLARLAKQETPVRRVILMNTDESCYTLWAERERIAERFPFAEVHHVTREAFDHAATRNAGGALSDAAYLLFMTMDAVPADTKLVTKLLMAMQSDGTCAIAYARQLAARDAGEAEKCARAFNYPARSHRKTILDEARLGIKAAFASNVCALYDRTVWEELGGFQAPAIFNEDMVYAHTALLAGYSIRYCADARVIHSHNYTARQQFHRNFDLGVSQAMHPEVFAGTHSESEGKKFVMMTLRHLWSRGRLLQIPGYLVGCAARYAGFLLGRNYRKLPRTCILKFTNNKSFWKA
ncbi:MAG: glycosyltransferase [Lachnospiraceae bacterium]|nr:glycosyltransferase [Lachnospiraceae bacterium]